MAQRKKTQVTPNAKPKITAQLRLGEGAEKAAHNEGRDEASFLRAVARSESSKWVQLEKAAGRLTPRGSAILDNVCGGRR